MVLIVGYLNPVTKNPAKIRNANKGSEKQFDFKYVKFPVCKWDYAKTETKQHFYFVYENKIPYRIYTTKETFEKYADLLLMSSPKTRIMLIKYFNRYMTKK